MLAHDTALLAFQSRLQTLSVCTTGSTTLEAVADGFTRAAGSFITDRFAVGMEVTPAGFADTTRRNIVGVTASKLTVDAALTAESSASGRTLTVGLPELCAWENVAFEEATAAGRWYIAEQYDSAPPVVPTFPSTGGHREETGTYYVDVFGIANRGPVALFRVVDALIALFPAGDTVYADSDMQVRVQARPTTTSRGQLRVLDGGVPFIQVRVPWIGFSLNS
jgi:hypothetical protein